MKDELLQRRRAVRGAAALLLVAVLAACQPAGPAGPAGSPNGSVSAPPVESDAAQARLTTTLRALIPGYTFEATVSLGGELATRAAGRWVNGSGEFDVEAQGATITYRTIPPQAWVLDDDSGWVELDSGSPLGNPIDALLKPTTLATIGGKSGGLDVRATYPAEAFGLTGAPLTVDLTLGPDGSVVATYRADTSSGTAVSETRMTPRSNLEPVAAPTAAP